MRTDPDFRLDRQLSNQKWIKANPDYWRTYRREHPEKTDRNRQLQFIRNRIRRRKPKMEAAACVDVIAKVDASIPNKFKPIGQYYLVPMIAKVDPLKVRIYKISTPYQ